MSKVKVENLSVIFNTFKAVDDISFTVGAGEIFGFLGANGAGKTTTIRVLCGLLVPTLGQAWINDVAINENNEKTIKNSVGYMSQKFTLYDDLTIAENLNFTAALRRMEKSFYLQRRQELLSFISFDKSLKTLVKDLPGGLKQQVSLVAALLHNPEIIFLDEPTAGVSPGARALFWQLIARLAQQGKTVFVTSHYMDEVEQCHRVALMRSGKIIALDTPQSLKTKTFSSTLFELTWQNDPQIQEVQLWRKQGIFESITPCGLSYHVTIADDAAWQKFQQDYATRLHIQAIVPTLEDVFIRLVQKL